jgi:serine/threonine protein kinase
MATLFSSMKCWIHETQSTLLWNALKGKIFPLHSCSTVPYGNMQIYLYFHALLYRGEMFDFIVAQKRVEEKQACKFFHQIIDGIEVIHRNEITHRDLKPEVGEPFNYCEISIIL